MNRNELLSRVSEYAHNWRKYLPALAIVIGVILLAYVATQYGTMYWEQRQLEREWTQQQQRQAAEANQQGTVIDDGLTRLSIPKIDLSAVIVEGTSRKKLLLGPGHLEETPAPGGEGNSVITAHRDTFFRHIHELSKGDELVVQRNGKLYTYEVQGKKVVKPTDVSVIKPSKDARLTLITCYPTYYIGPAPERLVVFSKLKAGEPLKEATPASVSSQLPEDSSTSAKQ